MKIYCRYGNKRRDIVAVLTNTKHCYHGDCICKGKSYALGNIIMTLVMRGWATFAQEWMAFKLLSGKRAVGQKIELPGCRKSGLSLSSKMILLIFKECLTGSNIWGMNVSTCLVDFHGVRYSWNVLGKCVCSFWLILTRASDGVIGYDWCN